jgi:hypothetical protein
LALISRAYRADLGSISSDLEKHVDHRAAHSARLFLDGAMVALESAESEQDAGAQSAALRRAIDAALEAVHIIGAARREIDRERLERF